MWLTSCKCKIELKFNRLAINQSAWEDPAVNAAGGEDVGTTDTLRITEARELVIVVGDVLPPKDTVLVQPRGEPWMMLPELRLSQYRMRGHKTIGHSWELAEKRLERILQDFKDKRAKERKAQVEGQFHLNFTALSPREVDK